MGTNSGYKDHNQEQLRKQWATEDWFKQQSQRGGGSRPSGCFPGDTQILTTAGYEPIADLSVGDWVTSLDLKTGQLCNRQVLSKQVYPSARLWTIWLAAAATPIVSTRAHRFLTGRGWVRVSALRSGDTLRRSDGASDLVVKVSDSQRYSRVYNLITEGEHTFFADGYVAHSFTYFPRARRWMYALIASAGWVEHMLSHRRGVIVVRPAS